MDPAAVPTLPPAPPADALAPWPRSAQWATAALLGLTLLLLGWRCLEASRWGTRPTDVQSSGGLNYRVDLNQAEPAELRQLPGVGETVARGIADYRRANGGFRSVDDLRRVPGVGPALLERVRPWVWVRTDETEEEAEDPVWTRTSPPTSGTKKTANLAGAINVNRASLEELQRLPGIGKVLSERIVAARQRAPFKSVDDLRQVSGIGAKTLERLRPYVTVEGTPAPLAAAGD